MKHLTQQASWFDLQKHSQDLFNFSIHDALVQDSSRIQTLSYSAHQLTVDLSRNFLTSVTIELLLKLAREQELQSHIENLFSGSKVNFTEQRKALHMALRTPMHNQQLIGDQFAKDLTQLELERFLNFADLVRGQDLLGFTGKPFTHLINIGVGGASLGPELIYHALENGQEHFQVHFISSLDGQETEKLLKRIPLETSLFLINSKSFTTLDTLTNANKIKKFIDQKTASSNSFQKHMVAISANTEAMLAFGILPEYQFKLWDFVGGRYSVWSAVGLLLAIVFGRETFAEFLLGGHQMDEHFKNQELQVNLPVLMGLLDVWYTNFLNYPSVAILPYASALKYLPSYLQQLFMESLGKSTNESYEEIPYKTGRIIWGDIGFIGQHAFFQLFHQGTSKIQLEFLIPMQNGLSQTGYPLALANALAQMRVLTTGFENKDKPYQNYPGNKPLSAIFFEKIDAQTLGNLIAFYEHRVFVQAAIWGINPFDQWGVELGKTFATRLFASLEKMTKYEISKLQQMMIDDHDL